MKAVAQAAKVVKWMEDVCPDMLSIAPLLGDMMFTGFKESRCAPVVGHGEVSDTINAALERTSIL